MLQGMYTGSTIVNERPAINPTCGFATKKMFSITKRYLWNSPYPSAVVFQDYPDVSKGTAISYVLRDWWERQGLAAYFYLINWTLESELTYQEKDDLMAQVIFENIKCAPTQYIRYLYTNTSRALKGEIWNYGESESKGLIFRDATWLASYGPPQKDFFKSEFR
jgi:hypothetical protein